MSKRKREKQGSSGKALKAIKSEVNQLQDSNTEDQRDFVVEVKKLLRNQATLLSGLNKLRDALKSSEPRSFAVFKEYVRENSECPEVYKVLEKGRQQQTPLELQISLEVLENLLLFTAEDKSSYGQIGMYHVRRILQNHLKLVYSCLNPTCHVNMIKGALRLLVAMVTQGAAAAREVVAVFDFTLKALGSLVHKRDVKMSEDIRTCFIHFTMSFLMYGDDATIRHVLDIKGFVSSIFKLFPSDSPDVVRLVLTVLHKKVVQNNSVPKKTKVQFFSSYVLTRLACLYNYGKEEEGIEEEKIDEKQSIRETIHNLLQDICCTFKFGICFANKMGMFAGRSNNPVLLRFLQSLPKHDQDLHLQQLIIQTLTCCPDLVQPYLTSQSTTYEPRLSLPWLVNINFIMKLYSALPSPSTMIEKSSINLNKDFLQSVLNTVIPSVLTRTNLNQGIQHSSLLVKNTTLSMLILILNRADNLLNFCKKETSNTNAEPFTQGLSFTEQFSDSLIKVLPDIKTIISLRQNLVASIEQKQDESKKTGQESKTSQEETMEDDSGAPESIKFPTLLLARALQALYYYQRIHPSILSTAAFDLGKLLPGKHDVIDVVFPPIVQHYTLEILYDLPRGTFKWYQQKSKNGPSYMYSVLKLLVLSKNNKMKNKAKRLVIKDSGVVTQDPKEVNTWLKHLNTTTFNNDQETLLVFLDSVCHSVAREPYTYTDVVMEMTSKARQADRDVPFLLMNVDDNLDNSVSRVAFSPLIVRALMSHIQMVSTTQDTYTSTQLCSIARYINLIILDILRDMVNPLPLILTVKRFYGNKIKSLDCASLKTTHQSLLEYIDIWTGDSSAIKTDNSKNQDEDGTNNDGLRLFLEMQASNPSQEDLSNFLCDLNEFHLQQAIVPCIQLCISKFAGDLRPLIEQLMFKPYCIIGSTRQDVFPLLKTLPFANLLWQVFGPVLKMPNFPSYLIEVKKNEKFSKEDSKNLLVHHPGVQTFLVESLERQELSSLPSLCNNLLQHLFAFVSKATNFFNEAHNFGCQGNYNCIQGNKRGNQGDEGGNQGHDGGNQDNDSDNQDNDNGNQGNYSIFQDNENFGGKSQTIFKTIFSLVFQLIDVMIERLDKALKSYELSVEKSPLLEEVDCFNQLGINQDKGTPSEDNCQQIQERLFETLLRNPVLLKCFLFKLKNKEQRRAPSFCLDLSFCIGNLLRNIVERIKSGPQLDLLEPYMTIVCERAVEEVTVASLNKEISSDAQALHLLRVFSPFCDQEKLNKPITKLLELPFHMLVKRNQGILETSVYYHTLLALLDSQANQVTPPSNQDSTLNDDSIDSSHMTSISNQKTLLSVSNFVKVTKLLKAVSSPQLDRVVLNILRTFPKYILEVESFFLDHCLDNVTEERVAMATVLISSSACLRGHFEQRCTNWEQDGAIQQLKLDDHFFELLPVVHCYFSYAESIEALSCENKVLSYLAEKCWSYLWDWIRESKRKTNSAQDLSCEVFKFLISLKSHDTRGVQKLFSKLLDLIPLQSWDIYQISTVQSMLNFLLKNCSDESKQRVLVGTTLTICMVNLSLMLQLNSEDKLLHNAFSMLVDIVTTHTEHLLDGEDSPVEIETWSTFVKNCLKFRFDCTLTLQCMTACVKLLYNSTKHKTLTREFPLTTMYQLILSHSKFLEIMLEDNVQENSKLKESLLDLVVAIAELCPECCQSSHLPVIFGSYKATLSKSDQSLLYLLHLYERGQVSLSRFRPYLWGKAALEHHKLKKIQGPSLWQQPSTNEVLELLDVTTLNRSADDFPMERKLKPQVQSSLVCATEDLSSLYDPCFLIPLFCHLLSQNSVVDCRKFVERGGLGYTVAALSSRDEHMRKAAGHVLSRCLSHMEGASYREKKQIYLLLESLKNGITDQYARVSSVITRFVSRAANIMLYPENQMYVLVNSFLLQRPVMDLREVPLFYTLFNSSSMKHRSERVWILQLLVEGLRDAQDYYVYKRRHVMELAMSYHDSQISDQQSRKLVIRLVQTALSIHAAAFDLAKNYAIVGWIHSLCLTSPKDGERLAASLKLLHTLWFTIQQGKPGACNEVDSGDEQHNTPYPPNLSQESLLVCRTLIKLFSTSMTDLSMLFELLSSVLHHLNQTSPQESRLNHHEILQIITLWCRKFNENQQLVVFTKELQLTEYVSCNKTTNLENEIFTNGKQKSMNQLLDILILWRPPLNPENESPFASTVDAVTLLACTFGLHFARNSVQTDDNFLSTEKSLLKVVKWFRCCLASSESLQKSMLSPVGEPCLQRLLFLFGITISAKIAIIQELNKIFLILVSRVQHVQNDVLGTTANQIAELLSCDVYKEVMSLGVVDVLLPLYPSPFEDETMKNIDVEVTELISVFLRDLWFGKLVPSHFLSLIFMNKNGITSTLSSVMESGSATLQKVIHSITKIGPKN